MIGRLLGFFVVMVALAACQKALSTDGDMTAPSLIGTEWGPENNQFDQFVAFKSEGQVIGSGGCNNFFGAFEQDGRKINFGPLASTKKACPQPLMKAENQFMALLGQVRTFETTIKTMTLYDDQGQVLATLNRRDWD